MYWSRFILLVLMVAVISCTDENKKFTAQIGEELTKKVYGPLMKRVEKMIAEKGVLAANKYYKNKFEFDAIEEVEKLTDEYRQRYKLRDLSIRRTSWRYRNPNNEPNVWQTKVFEEWQLAISEKEPLKTVVHEDKGIYTAMTPIFISSKMCLQCHGNVDATGSGVREEIKKMYPSDRARDFHLGQLRGATLTEVKFIED